MAAQKKSRYWAFVVYPDSAPGDWQEQLQLTGLRCAISPMHDRDKDPDGTEKKAHWHVIACWDGPTTQSAATAITDRLNAPRPLALNSVRGYYRYLTHKDNPDKFQYEDAEIQHLGGFNPSDYIDWTRSEQEAFKREIMQIIRDAELYEYADLLELLSDSGAYDLLSVAMNHTILFRGYLQSRAHRIRPPDMAEVKKIDPRAS